MSIKKDLEAKRTLQKLGKKKPKAMKGFMEFVQGIGENSPLSSKMIELISVALSINTQCEWCIAYHTVKALEEGATEEELTDVSLITATFSGGPAMMHSKILFDTIDEYKAKMKKKEQ
ncbi:MAG: carboxymuconolactone decarboxylase family protein [Promethearchaeota archaeon]